MKPTVATAWRRQTNHACRSKTPTITSTHGKSAYVRAAYQRFCQFFDNLKAIAPQLTPMACRYRILIEAMKKYLNGMILKPPEQVSYG
jgi:hypothetical protein